MRVPAGTISKVLYTQLCLYFYINLHSLIYEQQCVNSNIFSQSIESNIIKANQSMPKVQKNNISHYLQIGFPIMDIYHLSTLGSRGFTRMGIQSPLFLCDCCSILAAVEQ